MAFQTGGGFDDDAPLAEINIIPLVDVMLVLLIITMITSPFLEQGVNIDLPVAQGQNLKKTAVEEPIRLFISRDRNIRIGEIPVAREDLLEQLTQKYQERKNREIFVRADKEVPYGVVAGIMSELQAAGIERVGLVTQNE